MAVRRGTRFRRDAGDPVQLVRLAQRGDRSAFEQLYMRYVDSTVDGTTSHFFRNIEERLAAVTSLRLIDPSWLSCDELEPVQWMLQAFRERGGRIEYQHSTPT